MATMDNAFSKKLEAFIATQDPTAEVKTFIEFLTTNHEQLTLKAKEYRQLANELNEGASKVDVVAPTNEKILAGFDFLRGASLDILDGINSIRKLLVVKAPQMKVEDNDGVQVQMHVLELLNDFTAALTTGKKDDKGINLMSLAVRREYLTARVTAEEKVHKGNCKCGSDCECGKENKDCGCNKSKVTESSPALLGQLDADSALKISVGLEQLSLCSLTIVTVMSRNMKVILKPRSAGMSSMIG